MPKACTSCTWLLERLLLLRSALPCTPLLNAGACRPLLTLLQLKWVAGPLSYVTAVAVGVCAYHTAAEVRSEVWCSCALSCAGFPSQSVASCWQWGLAPEAAAACLVPLLLGMWVSCLPPYLYISSFITLSRPASCPRCCQSWLRVLPRPSASHPLPCPPCWCCGERLLLGLPVAQLDAVSAAQPAVERAG